MNLSLHAFASIVLSATTALVSCDQNDSVVNAPDNSLSKHDEAIMKFQVAQQRFKKLIRTVRDENSFDAAKPGLDQVIADWQETRLLLEKLSPPPEEDQARIREQISTGHRNTEPTGHDMMSLVMIESREIEVLAWLETFGQAGQEVGTEMVRLYGKTDYAIEAEETLKIDLSEIKLPEHFQDDSMIAGIPVFKWPELDTPEPWLKSKTETKDTLQQPAIDSPKTDPELTGS